MVFVIRTCLRLGAVLWSASVPFLVCKSYGLIGYMRMVVQEHTGESRHLITWCSPWTFVSYLSIKLKELSHVSKKNLIGFIWLQRLDVTLNVYWYAIFIYFSWVVLVLWCYYQTDVSWPASSDWISPWQRSGGPEVGPAFRWIQGPRSVLWSWQYGQKGVCFWQQLICLCVSLH